MISRGERKALEFVGRVLLATLIGCLCFFLVVGLQFEDHRWREDESRDILMFVQKWASLLYLIYSLGLAAWVIGAFAKSSLWNGLVIWFPLLMLGYWSWFICR